MQEILLFVAATIAAKRTNTCPAVNLRNSFLIHHILLDLYERELLIIRTISRHYFSLNWINSDLGSELFAQWQFEALWCLCYHKPTDFTESEKSEVEGNYLSTAAKTGFLRLLSVHCSLHNLILLIGLPRCSSLWNISHYRSTCCMKNTWRLFWCLCCLVTPSCGACNPNF